MSELTPEDWATIQKAVEFVYTGVNRVDVNISSNRSVLVYWAGSVLRIDIKAGS